MLPLQFFGKLSISRKTYFQVSNHFACFGNKFKKSTTGFENRIAVLKVYLKMVRWSYSYLKCERLLNDCFPCKFNPEDLSKESSSAVLKKKFVKMKREFVQTYVPDFTPHINYRLKMWHSKCQNWEIEPVKFYIAPAGEVTNFLSLGVKLNNFIQV